MNEMEMVHNASILTDSEENNIEQNWRTTETHKLICVSVG